ncbi:MAG: MFS transporter [Candidatus Bathyarchaeota archaeon]|nr:MFS transporter [Candidatus Bathyarchaeota archaeon]MDH5732201.1 MFS transporter [Candidatus Bathyarchaeota archaeon]
MSGASRLRSLLYLASGVFGINFALAIYSSTYTNFLVNDLNIDAFQIGALESIREVPGLLSAFILGSTLRFPQPSLMGSFLLIFSLGIGGVSTVDSWIQVVLWCVVWSIGFHSWGPLSSSITLGLSEQKKEGERLGQMNSVSSIAGMAAMASVAIFSSFFAMQYRLFFIVAGLIPIVGAFLAFRIPPTAKTFQKVRFVFKRRYSVYYVLNFLEGARRQIFLTFAPFVLVSVYSLNVTVIALLMFASTSLTFLSSPYLGKLVDRIGPRTTLTVSYVLMIGDFLGYAFVRSVPVLLLLYVLNSVLMIASTISRTTYINGIALSTDLTPSLAMGQTMDHVAAVILPLTGGILWGIIGYEATFFIGIAVATCLLLTAQKIQL